MPSKAKTGPKIPCICCNGTGEVNLPGILLRVLELVQEGQQTAKDIYAVLKEEGADLKQTAINNRLEDLRQMGFLSMRRQGRFNVYAVVERKGG